MKKLIYNENTKEINIVEQEDLSESKKNTKKEPHKVRAWLEKNKIFFEVFSYVFVGIMGIAISIVGWDTSKRSMDIYQKQLEIQDDDREPYFLSRLGYIEKSKEWKQLIYNEGGRITDAYVSIIPFLEIVVYHENEEHSFLVTMSEEVYYNETLDPIYPYNENDRRFYFDASLDLESELLSVGDTIEDEIKKYISMDSVSVTGKKYAGIEYINYKNEKHTDLFELGLGNLVKVDQQEIGKIIGELNDDNIEDIAEIIEEYIKDNKDEKE